MKGSFRVVAIGGGISTTVFAQSLVEKLDADRISLKIVERGGVELVDHVTNIDLALRARIVERFSDRPWRKGFEKGYMLNMLGGKAMIGASHLVRFYEQDFDHWAEGIWPIGPQDLNSWYSPIEQRNTYYENSIEEIAILKNIISEPDLERMSLSCNSSNGLALRQSRYSPVLDIYALKQKMENALEILTGCIATKIERKGAGFKVNVLDTSSGSIYEIDCDAVVLGANSIEAVRLLQLSDLSVNETYFGKFLSEHICHKWYFQTKSIPSNTAETVSAFIPAGSENTEQKFHIELKVSRPDQLGHRDVAMTAHAAVDPSADNKLILSAQKDENGIARTEVTFSKSTLDIKREQHMLVAMENMAEKLKATGIQKTSSGEGGSYHESSVLRMAAKREDGCVDAYGMVFDIDNLFVLGSAIFPSIGVANPTLTMMALAARAGSHLRRQILQ